MFVPVNTLGVGTTQIVTTALTTASVSMTVTAGTGVLMPAGLFYARLGGSAVSGGTMEYIQAVLSATDTFAITRNVNSDNGATLQAWPTGTVVQPVIMVQSPDVLGEYVSASVAALGGFATMTPAFKSNTAVATATSGTIATAGLSITRTSPAGAITAVVLAPGTKDGQVIVVENDAVAANTVTFAAAGTSNVADGVSDSIAGLVAAVFVWNATTALWYRIKAA
jgi:hypothetical protein